MTSVSKYVCIDKSYNIAHKCINKYRRSIKMKPIHVKTSTYIDFDVENNEKDPKVTVGEYVKILQCKNIVQKATIWIGQKKSLKC